MDTLYQSLVTVNPVTLIAQIVNLFIQLFFVKFFFLDKIRTILDQRRQAADREIADAQAAHREAAAIKQTYEQNMQQAQARADQLMINAQQTAAARGEQIISQARQQATQMKKKADADIALERKRALNDAKNEISHIAMAIAGKVVGRELTAADHSRLVEGFIDGLGEQL